jgi:hypothetical protein
MTEEEWLVCSDPFAMMDYLGGRSSARKRVLFVVSCWRDAWDLIPEEKSRQAAQMLEQYAETTMVSDDEYILKQFEIEQGHWQRIWQDDGAFQSQPPWDETTAATAATVLVTGAMMESSTDAGRAATEADRALAHAESLGLLPAWRSQAARHAALLRHLFGNPFCANLGRADGPSTIVKLAEALYEGQDCSFALHDGLLEAGHGELADHFRQKQWHPKGCWAVDLILGKK